MISSGLSIHMCSGLEFHLWSPLLVYVLSCGSQQTHISVFADIPEIPLSTSVVFYGISKLPDSSDT
jgi:hypothetical protein